MTPSAADDHTSGRSRPLDVLACTGLVATIVATIIVGVTAAPVGPVVPFTTTRWLIAIWHALPLGWTLLTITLAVVTLGLAAAAGDMAITAADTPIQRAHYE
ncbi:hypothetical protein LX12_004279 [Williamsia serinedens]|uniref:Uncharacterized protein n=1 Tax=Williamsia serinedens TaxID=391736 RepID=A0ABT1H7G0_9NOCA|nr:hypothetical protein [Williamsia serinedens]